MQARFKIGYNGKNNEHDYWLEIEYDGAVVTISDCASYCPGEDKSFSTIAISKSDFINLAKAIESL